MVKHRDGGTILVLTLVFTVILAVVVIAIANFATTGLKTSSVATQRTDTNADASATMSWAIEQFSKKQLLPDADCGDAPASQPIVVPTALLPNGYTATLTCSQTTPIATEPMVHLVARVTPSGGAPRTVEATVEVPKYTHGARIADWRVDIPIDVPAYVTTTTSIPSATTTTSTTIANAAPTANPTNWVGATGSSVTAVLDAFDSDGTIVSATIDTTPLPAGLDSIVSAGPSSFTFFASSDGTYNLDYTVTDDGGATASSTIQIVTSTTPPSTTTTTTSSTTTTTTIAPNPDCEFRISSVNNGGKSGAGTLSLSNTSGGAFTGWQLSVSRIKYGGPWDFTWPGPVGVGGSAYVIDSDASNESVTPNQGPTFIASATLENGPNGQKLILNDTFTCSMINPP
ncbi:MAG: hypothetical protein R8G01_15545 [Ilumatobacteraceae bacterium]|nr:hypothetical protein [Ilumatobacteraceae bacterium]